MKIFKINKMFFFYYNYGLFIYGLSGTLYQGILPYMQKNYDNFNLLPTYFFNLKSSLKMFRNILRFYSKVLRFGCFLEILISGIGYKCWRFYKTNLLFNLGYSHFIYYKNNFNIFFRITRNSLKCYSLNNFILGLVISEILSLRKIDIYKGKGLRLKTTLLYLKPGKQR